MVDILYDKNFKKDLRKISDKVTLIKIAKQIEKLKLNPELGKPMRYSRKGTRELYINPFRISYSLTGETILLLAGYHKDSQ